MYARAFDEILAPLARRWRPDLILVSAGYDAHFGDPLANMRLTVDGYVGLVGRLCALAQELCGGRLVALLEGGYNLGAVAASVVATCQVLAGLAPIGDPLGAPPAARRRGRQTRCWARRASCTISGNGRSGLEGLDGWMLAGGAALGAAAR